MRPAYDEFCASHESWLEDYALFRALKSKFDGAYYLKWPVDLVQRKPRALEKARRELETQMDRFALEQFLLLRQAISLQYAHAKGVSLIGDLLFFVSPDSSDVWADLNYFCWTSSAARASLQAFLPDYFERAGTVAGQPVYNWDAPGSTGYQWFIKRLRALLAHDVDVVRLITSGGLPRRGTLQPGHRQLNRGNGCRRPAPVFPCGGKVSWAACRSSPRIWGSSRRM
jgi:4-alpha-glucanotransferase